MNTSIKPYLSPVPPTPRDMEIALEVLFGRSTARELTPEQKAKQEAKQEAALAPYLRGTRSPW